MKKIAIANQKGGCGKTTVAINLAACLAREGKRVLLLDMDPQGHCALGLAVPEEQIEKSIVNVLLPEDADGSDSREISRLTWQIAANFDLAPSRIDLAKFEPLMASTDAADERLLHALEEVADRYDFCVIDCPPHVGLLTYNALRAAECIIVPIDMGYFSMHGLSQQLRTIEDFIKRTGQDVEVYVLANMYDVRTKLAREILSEVRKKFESVMLRSYINFNTKLKEGTSFGQPITEYDPSSMGCKDFTRLARELITHYMPTEQRVPDSLRARADAMAEQARQLLATTNTLIGPPPSDRLMDKVASTRTGRSPLPPPAAVADVAQPRQPSVLPSSPSPQPAPPEPAQPAGRIEPRLPQAAPDRMRLEPPLTPYAPKPEEKPERPITPAASEAAAPTSVSPSGTAETPKVDHDKIAEKINEIYGVHMREGAVLFRTHQPSAREVHLAGDFNDWRPQTTPMFAAGRAGDYEALLKLRPGRYRYRLVIDGRWRHDPNNSIVERNEYGELNSIVDIP